MGAGLAQVGILLLLTVIGLPLFFFGLMAALDHFERTLSAAPRTVLPSGPPLSSPGAAESAAPRTVKAEANVLTLPVAAPGVTAADAAASASAASSTANPAAAV